MSDRSTKYDVLKLGNQLCFPLYAATRLITKAYAPVLAEFELTYLQYLILMVLWESDQKNVKQIGEKLFLDSGTLTPVLKKMQQLKIISRNRSKEDDRIVINALTTKGLNLRDRLLGVPEKLFCQTKLEIKEAEQIIKDLKLLLSKVKNMS